MFAPLLAASGGLLFSGARRSMLRMLLAPRRLADPLPLPFGLPTIAAVGQLP